MKTINQIGKELNFTAKKTENQVEIISEQHQDRKEENETCKI